MTSRNATETDRARDTRAERERAGEWTLPGVEKGEEPKAVSSCHHPELSLASEPQPERKYLSLLNPQLTPQHVTTSISTPLSEAQEPRWLPGHRPAFTRFSLSSHLTKAHLHKPFHPSNENGTCPVYPACFPTLASSAVLFRFMIRQQKPLKANTSARNSFAAADLETTVQILWTLEERK